MSEPASPRRVAFWLVYAFGNLAFAFVWLLGQVPGSSHPDLLDYSPRLFNAALMAASILIDKNIRKNKKPVSHQDPQTVMNIVLAVAWIELVFSLCLLVAIAISRR